jgi:anti-sigma regulatory factor (Ser/Thr protein kinase)
VRGLSKEGILGEQDANNFSTAVREALINAIYHGNLEVKSNLREDVVYGLKKFREEIELKRNTSPYKDRKVYINYSYSSENIKVTIEDEGPGFDYKTLPDPLEPENLLKSSGRGLFIIRVHSDEVNWFKGGRVIEMIKYYHH